MTSSTPAIRLYVGDALAAGRTVTLDRAQAHYLRNVMRAKAGDALLLFNGRDGEWRASVGALGKTGGEAQLEARTQPQRASADLWLLFAPLKSGRIEFLVEKATELGVAVLAPVLTERTVVRRVNAERLRAHAVEAAEQSGRLDVPELRAARPLFHALEGWPEERPLFLCDETGRGVPVARAVPDRRNRPGAVLIGPEGGFAPAELDALEKLAFVSRVGLGPRILRAETAALAALACWQALAGDWQEASGLSA
ncbi:MAG TPA: 16S rRNA (uracil(1498)-N(3))-methyltransferase [Alphaproteobacteria bacterium]|jgi:16S rRNA (uracil1498-N3)-methyltransferase|nr:16S rRNA (uracil(1498)-N(3))-methyltransferase [Alphaproteobacteria bacterium]